jgi:hypothetical protein
MDSVFVVNAITSWVCETQLKLASRISMFRLVKLPTNNNRQSINIKMIKTYFEVNQDILMGGTE